MSEKKRRHLMKMLSKSIKLKKIYLRKTNYYRKLNSVSEVIIIGSNTIATTTLIMSLSIVAVAPLLILSLSFSGMATLGTALKRASNVQTKYEKHKSTYLAYSEIERELRVKITNTGVTDEQYDIFFIDLNNRLNLIEDNAITIDSNNSSSSDVLIMSPVKP